MVQSANKVDEHGAAARSRPIDVDRHVGLRIQQRRTMLGLTEQEIAELIGETYQQVYEYETGASLISAARLYQFACVLGVEINYFFEEVETIGGPDAVPDRLLRRRAPAPVKFMTKLMDAWTIDADETAKLLGFEKKSDVPDLIAGVKRLDTRDAKDRIRHLMRIREALHSLFQNLDAEREWLREPRPELQGQSPLALLLEGSMENLLTVSQFVQWMVGR